MADMAQEAMEALLVLHQPEKIEMWNPEAPINTFWDVRLDSFRSRLLFIIVLIDILYSQFASALQYLSKADPAPDSQLHGYLALAARGSDLPKCILTAAPGLRECRQPGQCGEASTYQAGSGILPVPLEHRYGRCSRFDELLQPTLRRGRHPVWQ